MKKTIAIIALAAGIYAPGPGVAQEADANIAQIAKEIRRSGDSHHSEMRELLQAREAVLVSEEFDAEQYLALSERIEKASAAKYDARNVALVEAAKDMTQEQRSMLSAAMRGRPYGKKK